MYFQRRGKTISFVYYDLLLKKNRRLCGDEAPVISDEKQAQAFCDRWNQKHDTQETKIQLKTSWKERFPEFENYLLLYERSRKEDAPYSWKGNLYYLKYYVFDYFLSFKKEADVNDWFQHFEDFREFLQRAPTIKQMSVGGGVLAYSTMNAVIKSLNSFSLILQRRNLLKSPYKCRLFAKNKCRAKDELSVMSRSTQGSLYDRLKKENELSAQFFHLCLHTGLRINEAFGLSLDDLFHGYPHSAALKKVLESVSLPVHGFISLESQPSLKPNVRNEEGEVPRKPLKMKRKISLSHSRTIPIFDAQCFNILVELWNQQLGLFQQRHFGENPKNYLLFEGLNRNVYSNILRSVQEGNSRIFTPHDTRHTYCTWLAEISGGSYDLCRLVLGHSSLSTTMAYVHMGARIAQNLRSKMQLREPMAFVRSEPLGQVIEMRRMK